MKITFETYPDMLSDYETGTENENYDDELRVFTVPKEWAVGWIRDTWNMDLDKFLEVYTWDDTYQMYLYAMYGQVILEEHTVLRKDWGAP